MARKSIPLYLLIFIFIQALLVGTLFTAKNHSEQLYFSEKLQRFEGEYRSIAASYGRLAQLAFNEVLDQDKIVELFSRATSTDKQVQQAARSRIYESLKPAYIRLRQQHFRQVHLHTPDGKSFLRMHLPEEFGDDLFKVRPSIRLANEEQRYISGFELGRHFHAFRHIFPISKGAEHLGSVGLSVPFYAINNALKEIFGAEYFLMLEKSLINKKLFPHSQANYAGTMLAEGYLYEKADLGATDVPHLSHIARDTLAGINQKIRNSIKDRLPRNEPFALNVEAEGASFLVLFLPLVNVSGETAGYLISYASDSTLAAIWDGYLVAYLLTTILLVMLLLLHRWTNTKLYSRLKFQQDLIDSIPTPICYKDIKGVFLGCNKAFSAIFSLRPGEIIGKSPQDLFPKQLAEKHLEADRRACEKKSVQSIETSMTYADGSQHELVTYKSLQEGENGKAAGIIGSTFDITELKKKERALAHSYAELDQIFNTAANGMRLVDTNHTIVRANKTFLTLTGLPEEKVVGKKCYEVFPGFACNTDSCPLSRILQGEELVEMEVEKILPDGQRIDCAVTSLPHYDISGDLVGIIEDFNDITKHRELEERLRDMAITDELTGLFNRRGFLTLAEKQITAAQRAEHDTFLLFADLDNMKKINDSLGHSAGDNALETTARLLKNTFRQADTIARLGGDEFAVLISARPGSDSAKAIISRLDEAINAENATKAHLFTISISFGVVQKKEEHTLEQLMARADHLMYACKMDKKNCQSAA